MEKGNISKKNTIERWCKNVLIYQVMLKMKFIDKIINKASVTLALFRHMDEVFFFYLRIINQILI